MDMAELSRPSVEQAPYGLLLARLGNEATARFRRSLRPVNLAAQQFVVLKQLQQMGPTSQTGLADALGIDYSNMANVTAELCDRGLMNRRRDEADRRRYVLALTDEGSQLVADSDLMLREGDEDMLSVLSETERDQLRDLLSRMADALQRCPESASETEACAELAKDPDDE
jgi:DNA-binding MarR family transcriptional regulator